MTESNLNTVYVSQENLHQIIKELMSFNRSINQVRSIGRSSMVLFFSEYCFNVNTQKKLFEIKELILTILKSNPPLILPQISLLDLDENILSWTPALRVEFKECCAYILKNNEKKYYIYKKTLIDLLAIITTVYENVQNIFNNPNIDHGKFLAFLFDSTDWNIQAKISMIINEIDNTCRFPTEWLNSENYFKITKDMLKGYQEKK